MEETEELPQTSSSRLGTCEVCNINNAKYTCPRCEVKTCNLNCSSIHKKELNCSGERDRTKYIPLNKFSNLDLASDYRLLEEISRTIEASKREKFNKRYKYNKKQMRLQQAAKNRYTDLKFLPDKFVRRKNNTSYYNASSDCVKWHIELNFVNADLKLNEESVPETIRLSTILSKYLVKQDNEVLQEKLQYYQAADIPGIKLLLKAERKMATKFYEMDPTLTLKDLLRNKVIIEYPIIYVVLKDHSHLYDILDSDDEEDNVETKNGKSSKKCGAQVVNNIVNHSERDDGFEHPLKNLLFSTDFSDDNLSDDD